MQSNLTYCLVELQGLSWQLAHGFVTVSGTCSHPWCPTHIGYNGDASARQSNIWIMGFLHPGWCILRSCLQTFWETNNVVFSRRGIGWLPMDITVLEQPTDERTYRGISGGCRIWRKGGFLTEIGQSPNDAIVMTSDRFATTGLAQLLK